MEMITPQWEHQKEAFERTKLLSCYALFWQPGCGKTKGIIDILRYRMNIEKRFLRTLVLTPPIVIKTWKDEFLRHSKIPENKIVLLTGSGKNRLKKLTETLDEPRVYVSNYESLLNEDLFEAYQKAGFDALVLDESHKIKDLKSSRTKLTIRLANGKKNAKTKQWEHYPIPFRYLSTGTPVLNSPMDLFTQFWAMDGGETFGENIYIFRATYFVDKNAGMPRDRYFPNWIIRPGALEKMNQLIQAKSMRVEKEDCLDLPPLVRQTLSCEMSPPQKKAYNEMKADFLACVQNKRGETETAMATMALTKALRLMQISSGFVKTTEGNEVHFEKSPKIMALEELLSELTPNHKVLVWCCWRENYAQIRGVCERLKIKYVEITGETPENERFSRVDSFRDDPSIRVFIGHPGSGGIGVSLTAASYSIFYSRTFSLEHSLQAESRCHRGGSEIHEKITRIDLTCEGTIDELVCRKLLEKEDISNKILTTEFIEALKNEENFS